MPVSLRRPVLAAVALAAFLAGCAPEIPAPEPTAIENAAAGGEAAAACAEAGLC